ncbi:MAG: YlxR family protein [Firmicutes bacterium]|nr:YlxR family protein [Bacillota bacterium]
MPKGPAPKRVPQRTCTGCRTVRPKKELLRVVRTPSGQLEVDVTGKKAGRGAYLCPRLECLEKAFKSKSLDRALEAPLPDEVKERLRQLVREVQERQSIIAQP